MKKPSPQTDPMDPPNAPPVRRSKVLRRHPQLNCHPGPARSGSYSPLPPPPRRRTAVQRRESPPVPSHVAASSRPPFTTSDHPTIDSPRSLTLARPQIWSPSCPHSKP
ncbi:unnamed protein product [Cuscuta campestris]|uniref:Uncharacterized protein n=1 Tax=Cuscuta campestris TaxID=132261 RepID=A0A484NU86_9ASTE|nr:unnamed protein product [Cuscuta campestris]